MSLLQNIEERLQELDVEIVNIEQFAAEHPKTFHITTLAYEARLFLKSKKKLKNSKVFRRETENAVWSFSFKSKNCSSIMASPQGLTLNQIIHSLKETEAKFKELENYKNINYKIPTYIEILNSFNK